MTDSGPASCPPTPEVDLLCTQLNTAEAERDAARGIAAEIEQENAELRKVLGGWDSATICAPVTAERDALTAEVAAMQKFVEQAMHLCDYGERAPGGDETWGDWRRRAEHFLRSGAAGGSLVGPKPQPSEDDEWGSEPGSTFTEWGVQYAAGEMVYDDQAHAEEWQQWLVQPNRVVHRTVTRGPWMAAAGPVVPEPTEHDWDFMQPATVCRTCGVEYHSGRFVNCPGAGPVVALPEATEEQK